MFSVAEWIDAHRSLAVWVCAHAEHITNTGSSPVTGLKIKPRTIEATDEEWDSIQKQLGINL